MQTITNPNDTYYTLTTTTTPADTVTIGPYYGSEGSSISLRDLWNSPLAQPYEMMPQNLRPMRLSQRGSLRLKVNLQPNNNWQLQVRFSLPNGSPPMFGVVEFLTLDGLMEVLRG